MEINEPTSHIRFLHYESVKNSIVEQIKQWCFDNVIESIESEKGKDLHDIIIDIKNATEDGKTVDMDFKAEMGEKGVKFIINYKIL